MYFIGGPGLSFRVHTSYVGTEVPEGIRNIDFNLIAGGGIHYGNFILEGRYDWGYVIPFKAPQGNDAFKNRTFAFMTGWTFGAY